MSKYPTETEGDWIRPVMRGYVMGCCDCGLVHRVNFRIRDGHVEMQVFRDDKRTARERRKRGAGRPWTRTERRKFMEIVRRIR